MIQSIAKGVIAPVELIFRKPWPSHTGRSPFTVTRVPDLVCGQ